MGAHAMADRKHSDTDERDESANERYDRNWVELLQELRVTQTGTQIISGFLLTLAFQQRFTELDSYQIVVFIVLVLLAATSTTLGLAPVSLHRTLFRRHRKKTIVAIGNGLLQATLVVVSVLTAGVVLLILDFVVSRTAGVVGGIGSLILLTFLLVILPRIAKDDDSPDPL